MKALHIIAFILLVLGGLNWGLVALGAYMDANWNVVNLLLGSWPQVEWFVYLLVGLSAIWIAVQHGKDCKTCKAM